MISMVNATGNQYFSKLLIRRLKTECYAIYIKSGFPSAPRSGIPSFNLRCRTRHVNLSAMTTRTPEQPKEPTRREIAAERRIVLRDYESLVRIEDEKGFELLLRQWGVAEGSSLWRLAWESWAEKIAEKKL